MMEAPCLVSRVDHLKAATDGIHAAATVTFDVDNGATVLAYHFGSLRADPVETVTTRPNAIINMGRALLIATPIPVVDALMGETPPASPGALQ